MRLYLSPSTQEHNIGAGSYGTEEAYCNHLADLMVPRLKSRGIEVFRNRPEMSLGEVVAESNYIRPDLHFAIHTNAMGGALEGKARGCEVYVYKRGGKSQPFADILYRNISNMTPWSDRGVREGYNHYGPGKHMYEVARTVSPAALIEIDFHDNAESVLWLLRNAESLASAMCASVEEFAGLPALPSASTAQDILTINAFLESKGEKPIDIGYWTDNAKAGQTCKGEFVAEAYRRLAKAMWT